MSWPVTSDARPELAQLQHRRRANCSAHIGSGMGGSVEAGNYGNRRLSGNSELANDWPAGLRRVRTQGYGSKVYTTIVRPAVSLLPIEVVSFQEFGAEV